MKKLIICLQILFLSVVLKAADTVSVKYFPLAVGNKWVYFNKISNGGPFRYYTSVTKITKDTIVNNKKYFFVDTLELYSIRSAWIRYDSITGHLNQLSGESQCNYERMLYDFSAVLNDSCNSNLIPCASRTYLCNQVLDTSLFGFASRVKSYYTYFYSSSGSSDRIVKYAKNIGLLYFNYMMSGLHAQAYEYVWLKGYIFNGQLFGDTSLTNINQISSEVPSSYSLGQNYPNPFNPTTKIKFDVASTPLIPRQRGRFMKLVVYDVTGREVQTLVNERLGAGIYEVKFDGSMLTSGVYFYKMVTKGFSETKRMLLIK